MNLYLILFLIFLGWLAYYYFFLWCQYDIGECRCDEEKMPYSGHLDGEICCCIPCPTDFIRIPLPHACICMCFLLCPNPWWDRKTMKAAWQRRAEEHILKRNREPVWEKTLSGRIVQYMRGEQPIPLHYLNTGPQDGSVATAPVNDGGPNAPEAPATLVMTRTRSGRLMAPLTGRQHAPMWQLPTALPAANLNDKDDLAQINVTVHGAPIAPPGPCYQPTGGVPSEPSAPPMPSAPPLPSAPSTPQEPGLEDVLAELRGLLASGAITQREFEDKAFGVEDALYEIQKKRDKGKLTQAEFEAEFARLNAENPAKFKPTNKGNIRRWEAKRAEAKRKERERERQIEATRRTNEFLEGKQQPCGLKVMGYALGYACVIS